MTDISVEMRLLLERDALAAGAESKTHLVIELTPKGEGIENLRPPLSVAFVLDASGSMNGPPLEHVQGSVEALLELLDPSDRVAVIAFADEATEVAPLQELDSAWKNVVKGRVRRLAAGGCTNMSAGMELGKTLLGERRQHERQLVVLLTDGMPNRGISDVDGLEKIAESMRPDIVTVTLGYGPHHAEDLLARLANAGSGEYFYIADPLEADDAFARAVGAQGDVVADAVELAFRPYEGVEIGDFLTRAKPRFGPRGLVVSHSDLLANRGGHVIVALDLTAPDYSGPWLAMDVELSYRVAGVSAPRSVAQSLEIPVKSAQGELVPEAHMRVLLAEAESARAEARAMADRGHYDGAGAVIRKLIERLEAASGFRPGDGSVLADALEQLVDERMAYERRPSAEAYRDFKRMQMGSDMQAGGMHHYERKLAGAKARHISGGTQGNLPQAYLVVTGETGSARRIPLTGEATIGRGSGNEVVIPSGSVSRRNTRIVGRRGKYMVVDLKSTNNTLLNGEPVTAPRILQPGDIIGVGEFKIRYEES